MALNIADTDVLIDFLQGAEPGASCIAGMIAAGSLTITAVTAFELLSGARDDKRGDRVRRFVGGVAVLPLDAGAAKAAALVRQDLERQGRGIGMADSLIAGMALFYDLPLITRNVRHYSRVGGLRLLEVGPTAPPINFLRRPDKII